MIQSRDGSLKTLGLFLTLQLICCLASGLTLHFFASHSQDRWQCGGKKRHLCIRAFSSVPVARTLRCLGGAGAAPQLPDPTAPGPCRSWTPRSCWPRAPTAPSLPEEQGISTDQKGYRSAAMAVLELCNRSNGFFLGVLGGCGFMSQGP